MGISVAKGAVIVLICLVLFPTCGEVETLFPSNRTYQIRTLVNGSSIEECSILRSNDKIHPYFASSVINDPDLIGLLVYLQDSQGNIIGDKVQYTLLPYADETALTEEDIQEKAEAEAAEAEATEPNETDETDDDEIGDDETEMPELRLMEQWSFTDAKPAKKATDIEIAVKSLSAELPYFPLPKELEIGPYVLVYEALGKRETLSRIETKVFYLGNIEFNLKDIAMYLPGLSGPQLISPETVIMLEASLNYDSRLDPYVIWYSGRNIISEGKLSDGAGKLLWKAPAQAGFYSLRLEAFPSHLNRAMYTGFSREIALPVSPKAVSLDYFFGNNQHFNYPAAEPLQHYQFEGSLRNSLSAPGDEQTLLPTVESRPRWTAAGQSYGLAIGSDDTYLLSPINFFRKEKDQGGGILLFHVRPLSEGNIFSAFFPPESSVSEGVWMDMIKKGNVIALRLSTADTFLELPVNLALSTTESYIPIAVEFYIRPYRLEAKISLDNYFQNKVDEIKLHGALSGEGRIRLGDVTDKSILDKSILNKPILDNSTLELNKEAALPEVPFDITTILNSAEEINDYNAATADVFPDTIWDELAIMFSTVPLLPGEPTEDSPLETEDDADAGNSPFPLINSNSDISDQERKTQERTEL